MSFPTTDPKFNAAFHHWADACRCSYNLNLYSADTLGELFQFVNLKSLRELCVLSGLPKSGSKTAVILRIIEALTKPNSEPGSVRGQISLRIVPTVVD